MDLSQNEEKIIISNALKKFKFFDKELIICERLDNYNSVRCKFQQLALETKQTFIKKYNGFKNIEDVIKKSEHLYLAAIDDCVNNAIEIFKENDIFDINSNDFFIQYGKKFKSLAFNKVYEPLEDWYINLIENESEKDSYRTARRQGRGRLIGGGFGIEGAAKGIATAGAFNLATNVVHGTFNLLGKAASAIGVEVQKSERFKDPNTLNSLANSVYRDCYNVHYVFVDILKSRGFDINYITQPDSTKANYKFNKIDKTDSKDSIIDTMAEILLLDPYEQKYYEFLIEKLNDKDKEIETIADYFGINVIEYKYSIVKKHYETLPISTLEEVKTAKDNLINYSHNIGGIPPNLCDEIDMLIESKKYEKICEFFNSMPKEILPDLLLCKEKIIFLCKELDVADDGKKIINEIDTLIFNCKMDMALNVFNTLSKATEEEALATKTKIIDYCNEIGLAEDNSIIQKIDDVIKQIDKNIRTIEGVEFNTREHASTAKNEKTIIESIIEKQGQVSRTDILKIITAIKELDLKTDIKNIYIQRYESILKDFDKKLIKAQRYDYRQKNNKQFYSGDKKDFRIHLSIILTFDVISLISCIDDMSTGLIAIVFYTALFFAYIFLFKYKKEYQAWEQLTHNGKYDLSEIKF